DGKQKMRQKVKAQYDPAVLNASMDPQKIVGMVQNAAKFAEKHKDTENGVRMLFYGLSGTGKTELARYISETLGKPLLLKRASDILGCYVGENEENIRAAFEEAERTDSILLFDEADTFFSDRNKAVRNWERSMVNEFLTQMEEFSGILICTTNLRKIMDPAMQRRFHILVEFKPMKFDGIKKMTDKYFPDFHLSRKEIEELEDMESVTPGDFGALASRIRFMNPDDVDSAYILEELKKMQAEKKQHWEEEESGVKRKIGFGA
ncbi:MAG: AAA family ATPase, partial [Treponema sp.]|nr:AAA family ATPase [Treponema sp.]